LPLLFVNQVLHLVYLIAPLPIKKTKILQPGTMFYICKMECDWYSCTGPLKYLKLLQPSYIYKPSILKLK